MNAAMKYRKKPVVNEAMRWTGDNIHDLRGWLGANFEGPIPERTTPQGEVTGPARPARVYVSANSAWLEIEVGEWVIRDSKGFYPCKADIFAATYELAEPVIEKMSYGRPSIFQYPKRQALPPIEFVDVLFDGPPSAESGRFLEVENASGASVSIGEWVDRGDGCWVLRIPLNGAGTGI